MYCRPLVVSWDIAFRESDAAIRLPLPLIPTELAHVYVSPVGCSNASDSYAQPRPGTSLLPSYHVSLRYASIHHSIPPSSTRRRLISHLDRLPLFPTSSHLHVWESCDPTDTLMIRRSCSVACAAFTIIIQAISNQRNATQRVRVLHRNSPWTSYQQPPSDSNVALQLRPIVFVVRGCTGHRVAIVTTHQS